MKSSINSPEQKVRLKEQTIDKETFVNEASKGLVMHHVNSFLDNNIEAVLSDYTNESVLITREATYSGLAAIRTFFVGLSIHFPKQNSNFVLDKVVVSDDLVYIIWHAETPSLQVPIGSDTFIIKAGKIYQQTFAGQLNFINQQS